MDCSFIDDERVKSLENLNRIISFIVENIDSSFGVPTITNRASLFSSFFPKSNVEYRTVLTRRNRKPALSARERNGSPLFRFAQEKRR